jgi:methylenetetrahydrofolate--tRNA-(uracil-5-)-methyltransferase
MGALVHHITGGAEADTFQPMNVNFGLFPPLAVDIRKGRKGKRDRALAYTVRAKASFGDWLDAPGATISPIGMSSA